MSIADAREALAAAFDSIPDLRCGDGMIRDQVNPPEVMLDYELDPHLVFGSATAEYTFTAKTFLNRTAERSSQALADRLKDPTDTAGIVAVIEGWSTTAYHYAAVRKLGAMGLASVGGVEYLMFETEIEVVL